jgi:predicted nicotinamide N-methyase
MPRPPIIDPATFIRANLWPTPVPGLGDITLYTAHPGSGLGRLVAATPGAGAPYWAYPWAGGLALARYVRDHPEAVAGRRVLDLGAGSGLVAIAAAKAGAARVLAAETDVNGLAALRVNIEANGVTAAIEATGDDLLDGPPPAVDTLLVGDLFYDRAIAARVTAFLDRCVGAGLAAVVGDPGRAHLPRQRLSLIAEYGVADVGTVRAATDQQGLVFSFGADEQRRPG